MILKKVYISRGEGGGQGQFGKSLHFDFFFFYDGFPKATLGAKVRSKKETSLTRENSPNHSSADTSATLGCGAAGGRSDAAGGSYDAGRSYPGREAQFHHASQNWSWKDRHRDTLYIVQHFTLEHWNVQRTVSTQYCKM